MADEDKALAEGAATIAIVQTGAKAGEAGAMPGYYYASSSHIVPQGRSEAFDAVNAALVKLGLVILEQSRDLGVISAEAPSPLPLSTGEFDKCAAVDLPRAGDHPAGPRNMGGILQLRHERPRHGDDGDDRRRARRIRDLVHDADARSRPSEDGLSPARLSAAERVDLRRSTRRGTP